MNWEESNSGYKLKPRENISGFTLNYTGWKMYNLKLWNVNFGALRASLKKLSVLSNNNTSKYL